jgi:hypothetical protein
VLKRNESIIEEHHTLRRHENTKGAEGHAEKRAEPAHVDTGLRASLVLCLRQLGLESQKVRARKKIPSTFSVLGTNKEKI